MSTWKFPFVINTLILNTETNNKLMLKQSTRSNLNKCFFKKITNETLFYLLALFLSLVGLGQSSSETYEKGLFWG